MCTHRNSTKVWIPHQKRWVRIDECIADEVRDANRRGIKTLASCCGHKKYPKTIILYNHDGSEIYDFVSRKTIPRVKRFYAKDKKGFYFIPECKGGKT